MVDSNLEKVHSTLEDVKKKLEAHRDLYETNERAVCSQIIEPVLKSLGWDPQNPTEVRPEVSTEEGRADYILFQDGKEILPIEAKKLGVDIRSPEIYRQLAKYAFDIGTSFGVITNGMQWALVKSFEEGVRAKDREVWFMDLEQTKDQNEDLRKLLHISKEKVNNLELIVQKSKDLDAAWGSLFAEPDQDLVTALSSILQRKTSNSGIEPAEYEEFVTKKLKEILSPPDTEYESPNTFEGGFETEESRTKNQSILPSRMSIQNTSFQVSRFKDVLVNTAEWLIKKGKLSSNTSVPAGPKRNLISRTQKHRNGEAFRVPKKLSNGLYIETHYSGKDCERYARKLLKGFGYKETDLVLH